MDYTIEQGEFYKVVKGGKVITFGQLRVGEVLSTNEEVEFISKEEFDSLQGKSE